MTTETKFTTHQYQQGQEAFLSALKEHSSSFESVLKGRAFPDSFPFKSFPLERIEEFVLYHKMKTGWGAYLDEKFGDIDKDSSLFFVEGANWGDWDAFGAGIRTALGKALKAYFDVFGIQVDEVIRDLRDEIPEILLEKTTDELRLSGDNRDYRLAVLRIDKAQIESLAADLGALVEPLNEMQEAATRLKSFSSRMEKFKKESKTTIYQGDYNKLETLDQIIRESNRLITDYNEMRSGSYDPANFISEIYIAYEDGHISISTTKNATAEVNIVETNFVVHTDAGQMEKQIEILRELTHMARKEKESYEANRMNKSLFRLQIIMTISLFTSAAALFTVSMSQVKSNWDIVLIMLAFSIVLTLGTYFFVAKR
ncbi:MAG: hypothetical protein U5Q03_18990 [Bacteroidota bacterium]|nr:hypothetical protein [Bacteroidota bacterium]